MGLVMDKKTLELYKENKEERDFIELQKEFGGLIIYYAQKLYYKTKYFGEELEDCIQQCWICFLKAVENYDIDSNHTFAAFLVSCLTHYMLNRVRDFTRKRGGVSVVSIDNYLVDDESISYLELFESDYLMPNQKLEQKEILENFIGTNSVTSLEKLIFLQHLKGYTYEELSKMYSIQKKKIDNIIRKVKCIIARKLK